MLDDIIVWWIDDEIFDVMPNASNTSRVVKAVGGRDTTDTRAVIAVQGPRARDVVRTVSADASAVPRFQVGRYDILDTECVVAGTGYTGEDGLEIAVPAADAPRLWRAFEEAGAVPAGLGARDTLRLEAGLPLHGHELGAGITPLQARLGWVVSWAKPTFHGRDALMIEKDSGPTRLLIGITIEGRRPAREGCAVFDSSGTRVGEVTSGNFSPTLGHCIAFAFLPPTFAPGDSVVVDVRGTRLNGTVTPVPFVTKAS